MAGKIKNSIGYYCDVPMAEKKRYFPCDKRCEKCLACIVIRYDGTKEHISSREDK